MLGSIAYKARFLSVLICQVEGMAAYSNPKAYEGITEYIVERYDYTLYLYCL